MICDKHPAIIKLIGYSTVDFHDENNVTIIMDLATNGSLLDVIKSLQRNNGPKDYTNTSRQIILFGVSRGMKYLHDRNIIHRDLKPGNILLDDNFHPLITDFGFSKYFEVGVPYIQSNPIWRYNSIALFHLPKQLKKLSFLSFASSQFFFANIF